MNSYSNISKLSNYTLIQSTNYFVDANVWLYALQGDDLLEWWSKMYSDFFYKIVESDIEPRPKILLPSLLFSEILNTYLKLIALPEYKTINGIPENASFQFKKDYRPTIHYKDSYEKLCDDILSLKSLLIFLDDKSIITNPPLYLTPAVDPFDFNDYFYYQICREFRKDNSVTILTNDSDFQIKDIPIITLNKTLLRLS